MCASGKMKAPPWVSNLKSAKVKNIKVRNFGPKGIKVGSDFLKVKKVLEVVVGGARPPRRRGRSLGQAFVAKARGAAAP